MADQSGRLINVGIAKEATRGTGVTPSYWLQHTGCTFVPKSEKAVYNASLGVLNESSATAKVKEWAEGNLSGLVNDKSFGLVLLSILGTVNSVQKSEPNTGVYDHTITQQQSNLPTTLTVQRKDVNNDEQFVLATASKLSIEVAVGEYVKYDLEVTTKKGTTVSTTRADTAENVFVPRHATLKVATTSGGLAGATAIPVKSFRLEIERKVNAYFAAGSDEPNEILVETFATKGDFTLRYTDNTYRTIAFADTPYVMQLTLANTGVTIGSNANPTLQLTLSKLSMTEWDIDQALDAITEQTVGFTGHYSLADTKELTAVLTNTVVSY